MEEELQFVAPYLTLAEHGGAMPNKLHLYCEMRPLRLRCLSKDDLNHPLILEVRIRIRQLIMSRKGHISFGKQ